MPILNSQQMTRAQANIDAMNGRGVSASQARNSAQEFALAMNGRGLPVDDVPESVKQWAKDHPVRIFNVGPWPQRVMLGTLGTFYIPACPQDEACVEMTKKLADGSQVPALEGLIFEPIREDGRMSIRQHDGKLVAMDIVGIGPFQAPQNALTKFGVFIAEGERPTAAELKKAQAALHKYLESLVIDARKAQQDGKTDQVVGADHFMAARLLKLNPNTETWMKTGTAVATNEECPNCGTPYRAGLAQCRECKMVLDREKHKKNFPELYAKDK